MIFDNKQKAQKHFFNSFESKIEQKYFPFSSFIKLNKVIEILLCVYDGKMLCNCHCLKVFFFTSHFMISFNARNDIDASIYSAIDFCSSSCSPFIFYFVERERFSSFYWKFVSHFAFNIVFEISQSRVEIRFFFSAQILLVDQKNSQNKPNGFCIQTKSFLLTKDSKFLLKKKIKNEKKID